MDPSARGVVARRGASLVVATLVVVVLDDGDRGRVVRSGAARLVVAVVDKDDGIPRAGSVAGTRVGPGCSGGAGVGAPVWGSGGRGAGGGSGWIAALELAALEAWARQPVAGGAWTRR